MDVLSTGMAAVEGTLKEIISGLLKKVKIEINHIVSNKLLEYEVTEFSRNYYTKTILHRTTPIPLEDFYVSLFLNPVGNKWRRIGTSSAEKLFEKNNVTLFGDAGSGKSTLIKYLFADCIRSKYKIPLKIELRFLSDYKGTLIDFIKLEIIKLQKIAEDDNITERLLDSGGFVIFLDGYDEIKPTERQRVTQNIDNLVKVFSKNNYFLTSRPHTNIDLLTTFHNYEMCPFKDYEVEAFINRQLPLEKDVAIKMIKAIRLTSVKHFSEFFSNSLLLSMFILTFRRYNNLPDKRSIFYSQVFNTLYAEHDQLSKPGFVRVMLSGLSYEGFDNLLKVFSFISYFESKYSFGEDYIYGKLNDIKARKKELVFDNRLLLSDLKISIGILTEDGLDFTFPHRSMQEYFAAKYIADITLPDKIKVYSMLWDRTTGSKTQFIYENKNFFIILLELDLAAMLQYILSPLLKTIFDNIKAEGGQLFNYTNLKLLEYFSDLNFLLDNFLFTCQEFDADEKEFHAISVSFSEIDETSSTAQFSMASSSMKFFMNIYPSWADKITSMITNQIKSDAEIIALII